MGVPASVIFEGTRSAFEPIRVRTAHAACLRRRQVLEQLDEPTSGATPRRTPAPKHPTLTPTRLCSQLLNSTIQSIALAVNKVLTATYHAVYDDAKEGDELTLLTAPLCSTAELQALFDGGRDRHRERACPRRCTRSGARRSRSPARSSAGARPTRTAPTPSCSRRRTAPSSATPTWLLKARADASRRRRDRGGEAAGGQDQGRDQEDAARRGRAARQARRGDLVGRRLWRRRRQQRQQQQEVGHECTLGEYVLVVFA